LHVSFTNSAFCPHSVFMCSVWISEQTTIISLYNINWLVCVTETECVYCAVRTVYLYMIRLFVACSSQSRAVLPPVRQSPELHPSVLSDGVSAMHAARMGVKNNAYRIMMRKPWGRLSVSTRWEDNINANVSTVTLGDVQVEYRLWDGRRTAWHRVMCYQADVGAVLWQKRLAQRQHFRLVIRLRYASSVIPEQPTYWCLV
jgi:hypothetical protein